MTSFTKINSKFWEDYYNEKGRSNDESKMNERSSIQLSEYSYIFKVLRLPVFECSKSW